MSSCHLAVSLIVTVGPKSTKSPSNLAVPKTLVPLKSMLPPARECNLAHSGVPGTAQYPGHEPVVSQGLKNDVQDHFRTSKWSPKIIDSRGPAAGGEALQIRRTPSGELSVLNTGPESQNLKTQAGPAPHRRPLPKVPQNRSIC